MAHQYTSSGLDTEAEEGVYRLYAPRIFAYLLRHVPSYQDAEDLLLEVFRVVLEKLPTLDQDEQRLGGYIQTIASRKMADYYRKRSSIQLISLEEIAEMIDDPGPRYVENRTEGIQVTRVVCDISTFYPGFSWMSELKPPAQSLDLESSNR